jgi:hypothetical protein
MCMACGKGKGKDNVHPITGYKGREGEYRYSSFLSLTPAALPILSEAGWVPGPVWTGAENLAPTGIRSTDRPVRSD